MEVAQLTGTTAPLALAPLPGLRAQRHQHTTASAWDQRRLLGAAAAGTRPGALVPKRLATACLHRRRVRPMTRGALDTRLVAMTRRRRELGLAHPPPRPSTRQHLVPSTRPRPARSTPLLLAVGRADGALIVHPRPVLSLHPRLAQVEATTAPLRLVAMVPPRRLRPVAHGTRTTTEEEWWEQLEQRTGSWFISLINSWAFWRVGSIGGE